MLLALLYWLYWGRMGYFLFLKYENKSHFEESFITFWRLCYTIKGPLLKFALHTLCSNTILVPTLVHLGHKHPWYAINYHRRCFDLRSLHTESEIHRPKFRTLYDLTLCQSLLHTAFEIFVRHKKIRIGFYFFRFSHPWQHFERCFDSSEPLYKQTPKSGMVIVKFIHFVSQHKALFIDPCTLSSQKLWSSF